METEKLELSEKIEKRLEMIYAHTKFGKTVRYIIEEFNVSLDTYYYWYHRYEKMGIFGLFESKNVPKNPHNKTGEDIVSNILEIAENHSELDVPEILKMLSSHVPKPSISTAQRILQSKGLNRPRGRRSKKTIKKKKTMMQPQIQGLKK